VQNLRNLADAIRRNAHSDNIRTKAAVIRTDGGELSWTELDEQVDYCARGLRELTGRSTSTPAARVAIALPNSVEFVVAYFAALRARLVAMPINPTYTGRELRQLLDDAGAEILVAIDEVLSELDGAPLPYLAHRYVAETGTPSRRRSDPYARPFAELGAEGGPVESTGDPDDLAILLYTSGSEGRPKSAMLSHRALLANHEQLAAIEPPPVASDDVVLLAVPLFHAYGLNSGLGAVAYHGATGVLVDHFDAAATLEVIGRTGVSALIGVPAMFSGWAAAGNRSSLESVRLAVCGAAPLDRDVAARFAAVWGRPPAVGYGLTETAPVVTTTLASAQTRPGSIGRPLPGIDVRLVNPAGADVWRSDAPTDVADDFDDDAAGSPGTDPGEIVVRGANLFSGYWPDGRDGPAADGWWATGDVAYADPDGDLYLVDRLRELILVNGFNVYPAEVEHVLMTYPGVSEVAVLAAADDVTGQTVKAYVVAAPSVTPAELAAHSARNLARFKCPTTYEFVAELPHSATGKVRKGALRDASPTSIGGGR
jgi:long-chain acyl-CoA synthetase